MCSISYNILSMSLTRTHIAFLGIISVFTGLVWPGTHSRDILLSYLMTDARWIAYAILIALILAFTLASLRKWYWYKISVILTVVGIVVLGLMTFLGHISAMKTGELAYGVSWWWIFLIIGSILLLLSYRRSDLIQDESQFSDVVDTIIGMVWGFALACIAGILILSSLSFFSRGQSHEILSRMYVSSEIESLSGDVRSIDMGKLLPSILYDRGNDSLLTSISSSSGTSWKLIQKGMISTGTLKAGQKPLFMWGDVYSKDMNNYVYSGGRLLLGSRISEWEKSIVYKEANTIHMIYENGTKNIEYKWIISSPLVLSKDRSTLAWTSGKIGEKRIIKNGIPLEPTYSKIENIALSWNWQSIVALAISGSGRSIIKNGVLAGILPPEYISGSYISNGSHFLYIIEKNGIKKVVHDMEVVSRDLTEVREVFLEEDGWSYAYFGRPLGEERYCLFTRYKGNLCWLQGYMNPVLWADGGSLIFAWKKENIWSIYRNADEIIKNTGYMANTIAYDYVFFDTTNPRSYLFIQRDPSTWLYTYRKNGILLPWTWKDISTEVSFGYDSHILTAAQDASGWKILEL